MNSSRSAILACFALLLAAAFASACDPSSPLTPATPTTFSFRFPTPYPPMEYPTEEPTANIADPDGTDLLIGPGNIALKPEEVGRLQQELLQVEVDSQAVRGLEPKNDVSEHFVTREQLRSLLLEGRDTVSSREQVRLDELRLWLLRFTPKPKIDMYQMQADWLSERLLGYYDPSKKELFVLTPQLPLDPVTRQTVAHEFVHTLQDQYFDMQKLLPPARSEGDRDLAVRSLVEGDAILSSAMYADQFMSHDDFAKLPDASGSPSVGRPPNIVKDSLYFPYTRGVEFVKNLYSLGGFPAVNNALTHPPVSTEQILHPQKYLATPRDDPQLVGLPPLTDTLGAGWTYKDTQFMGEFELDVLLRTNGVPDDVAQKAAEGWGGGQCDLYQNDTITKSLAMLLTKWDTTDDAMQFYNAMLQSLSGSLPIGSQWTDGARYFGLRLKGDRVLFVSGTDRNAVSRALDAVR